ncbi:hypothetical protein [Pseudomonas sp. UBA6323]|jgi:hypothetical protein|uniref:hypothetical protein n=1 Tax=Pseudomonas sp. UBA6323 TaxID=1947329 RepID=UPI0013C2D20C|nr:MULTISPECIES: hypothetical protein [unclassified Pseudomonas]
MAKDREVCDRFRKKISNDLRRFQTALINSASDVCRNAWVLDEAAAKCIGSKPSGDSSWGYEVSDLQFKVRLPQKVYPSPVEKYLDIHVDFKIEGGCTEDFSELISHLELNIVICTPKRTHISSWHFDRHIEPADFEDNEPEDAHPLYHFQYGGRKLDELDKEHGRILILPAPRIGHPPMDVILAVDFVLSNFAGDLWRALKSEPDYISMVSQSQRTFWRPYLENVFSWWQTGPKPNEKFSQSLWPHLVS